ncbi:MAG: CSLREA domain-containing protein [Anaerolineae bacterium]|nr:CSLREA domain-containing protein [Anaerolineae bacterium]
MRHPHLLTFLLSTCLALLAGLLLLPVLPVLAAGPEVNTAADDESDGCGVGYCTLREAITDAADGNTITFAGSYTIYLNSQLNIFAQTVTLDGETNTVTISGDSGGDGTANVRVFYIGDSSVVTLTHLSIVSGTTNSGGGGIYNTGTLTVQDCTLSGNSASDGDGGGIYNVQGALAQGILTVQDSTLSGNSATGEFSRGGGISNYQGILTMQGSTLSGNSASYLGGGISNFYGKLSMSNSTLSNNSSSLLGGGIHNQTGVLTVTNSTLFSNSTSISGGGIHNETGVLTVTNSTLFSNSAPQNGGGISNYQGTLTVQNSTFSHNAASYGGGGIYNNQGTLAVQNSTLSRNSAIDGWTGGIVNNKTLHLLNTLVANNFGGDCSNFGNIATNDHNLIQSTGEYACNLTNGVNGTIIGVDPLLGPLANNGGNTQTMALLATSKAINAGNNATCLPTDQRGIARPLGTACEIGAFEAETKVYLPAIMK